MNLAPLLYPAPRSITVRSGILDLAGGGSVAIPASLPVAARAIVERVKDILQVASGRPWHLDAESGRLAGPVVRLGLEAGVVGNPQGYRLTVDEQGVVILGEDEPGLFYGVATLGQLLTNGPALPLVAISDYPAIGRRGAMLDVSRDRVQTLDTLKLLIDDLASLKYNELQLYVEHAFAYPGHETVWGDASPLTAEDILDLDAYCRERYMELVPNQNTLGHMHKWLEHPRYAHLAENYPYRPVPVSEVVVDGDRPFWGDIPYSICPSDPEAVSFVLGLLDQYLPFFSSRMVNVGLDEPFDLACGRSRDADPDLDPRELYVGYLRTLHQHLSARGYTLQMWGDFVAENPESVAELPSDVIVVDWGYWKDYPFDERAALHAAAGRRFYLATGTNAWCSIGGRWEENVAHMRDATHAALRHGAEGILVTDWGWFEHGTYQQHVISYVGFFLGAGEMWSPTQSREVDFPLALSRLLLGGQDDVLGRVLVDFGRICPGGGRKLITNSPLYWALRNDLEWIRANTSLSMQDLDEAEATIDGLAEALRTTRSTRHDGQAIVRELELTARLLRHAVVRTRLALTQDPARQAELRDQLHAELPLILGDFHENWLRRYRVGGLVGTSSRLAALDSEYRLR